MSYLLHAHMLHNIVNIGDLMINPSFSFQEIL